MKVVILVPKVTPKGLSKELEIVYKRLLSKKLRRLVFYVIGKDGGLSYIKELRPVLLNNISAGVEVHEIEELDSVELNDVDEVYVIGKNLREKVKVKRSSGVKFHYLE